MSAPRRQTVLNGPTLTDAEVALLSGMPRVHRFAFSVGRSLARRGGSQPDSRSGLFEYGAGATGYRRGACDVCGARRAWRRCGRSCVAPVRAFGCIEVEIKQLRDRALKPNTRTPDLILWPRLHRSPESDRLLAPGSAHAQSPTPRERATPQRARQQPAPLVVRHHLRHEARSIKSEIAGPERVSGRAVLGCKRPGVRLCQRGRVRPSEGCPTARCGTLTPMYTMTPSLSHAMDSGLDGEIARGDKGHANEAAARI